MRVLIVHPDLGVLSALRMLLRNTSWDVQGATAPTELKVALGRCLPDLLVLSLDSFEEADRNLVLAAISGKKAQYFGTVWPENEIASHFSSTRNSQKTF